MAEMQRESYDVLPLIEFLENGLLPQDPKLARRVEFECKDLFLDKGVLKRKVLLADGNEIDEIYVPQNMRLDIMRLAHDKSGHAKHFKCIGMLKAAGLYWSGSYADMEKYIKSCDTCIKATFKGAKTPQKAFLKPHETAGIFSRIHIDILKIGVQSSDGYNYVLSCVDSASRYPFVFPLRTQNATEIADRLIELMSFTGIVGSFFSDRGQNFLSKIISELSKTLGIKRYVTSSRQPRSNGLVEHLNKKILQAFRHVASGNDWPKHIPYILTLFRSAKNRSTGFSPHHILFGYEMRSILGSLFVENPNLKEPGEFSTDYMNEFRQNLETIREIARKNIEESGELMKDRYDTGKSPRQFHLGEPCYMYSPVLKKGESHKISRNVVTGPYYIAEVLGANTYILRNESNSRKLQYPIHQDKLIPYHGYLRDPELSTRNTLDVTAHEEEGHQEEGKPTESVQTGRPQEGTKEEKTVSLGQHKDDDTADQGLQNEQQQDDDWYEAVRIEQMRKRGKDEQFKVRFTDGSFHWCLREDVSPFLLKNFFINRTVTGKIRKRSRNARPSQNCPWV